MPPIKEGRWSIDNGSGQEECVSNGQSGPGEPAVTMGVSPVPVIGPLQRFSDLTVAVEKVLAGSAVAAIFLLLITNVITRALGTPLIWIDELAVYVMIAGAFVGASIAIRAREHIAVTLLGDVLGDRPRALLGIAVDLAVILFFVILAVLQWLWWDPVGVLGAESLGAYSDATFNFLYDEPTTTIGIRKAWFWSVLPLFCLTALVHALANMTASIARLRGAA